MTDLQVHRALFEKVERGDLTIYEAMDIFVRWQHNWWKEAGDAGWLDLR